MCFSNPLTIHKVISMAQLCHQELVKLMHGAPLLKFYVSHGSVTRSLRGNEKYYILIL